MQGIGRALRLHGNRLKHAVLQRLNFTDGFYWPNIFTESAISTPSIPHKGLENITISELIKAKGDEQEEEQREAVYWCRTNDTVYNAVQNVIKYTMNCATFKS